MNFESLPRLQLAQLPTPLMRLGRLTRKLGGPQLWIKRDDQTGLALGGNKVRKLEFLVGAALAQGADTLVTLGAVQSNHCRQTAAAAAVAGLSCELLLNGRPPECSNGNLLLDELLGATVHWIERAQRAEKLRQLETELCRKGAKPYVIPVGGSNGLGALGYVVAMQELQAQLRAHGSRVDHLVVASSSGGTQAGMVLGARLAGFAGRVTGISIDRNDPGGFEYEDEVAQMATDCARQIGSAERLTRADVHVAYGYRGGGYGVLGELERQAIRLLAREEGIFLDPVYTGRAFGALLDLIRKGQFQRDESVLFWHTGGAPALFAQARELAVPPRGQP
ncbi:MAG TPA: D-cysteine desulfhydrase family protein [Verrucomicrobiota bacterium]|nr:D-cysteine desulfhydrase family protein [Verrucomicrobiota bacterium]HNT15833.1 D-cysteine desulfhydrase family protein [Verrucomicrobiota bacterium]